MGTWGDVVKGALICRVLAQENVEILLVVISHQTEKAQKLAKFDHDSANAVLIFRDQVGFPR